MERKEDEGEEDYSAVENFVVDCFLSLVVKSDYICKEGYKLRTLWSYTYSFILFHFIVFYPARDGIGYFWCVCVCF